MFDHPFVLKLIDLAIEEDIGGGDVTSELMVPAAHVSSAGIEAREGLVICGLPLVRQIFCRLDAAVRVDVLHTEGEEVEPGTLLCRLSGATRALLGGERTVLNFLQRLCGIATFTRQFVRDNPGIEILDTRKTTPGWRMLEKLAVKTGGAANHRFSLSDMVLVKNNHIDAAAQKGVGLESLLSRVKHSKPSDIDLEIEVRNAVELEAALKTGPDMIMLDNMNDAEVARCLPLIRARCPGCKIEVSGGVDRQRLKKLKKMGVDCVSVGALTRKATFVDVSMHIVSCRPEG